MLANTGIAQRSQRIIGKGAQALAAAARGPEPVAPALRGAFARLASAHLPGLDAVNPAATLHLSLPHNIWSPHSLNGVQLACMRPGSPADCAAAAVARLCGGAFELLSGLGLSRERLHLQRLLLLAALSSAPGRALAAPGRRAAAASGGDKWAGELVAEAEREATRLHVLLEVRGAGPLLRGCVRVAQASFGGAFLVARFAAPRFSRWLGSYVEEEQVQAYTQLLEDIESGLAPRLAGTLAPPGARAQYGLPEHAGLREVVECMRAERMLSR